MTPGSRDKAPAEDMPTAAEVDEEEAPQPHEMQADDLAHDIHDENSLVVFVLSDTEFGVEIDVVDEVVRVPPITPIPFPPEDISGVVSIRGSILPVMDLGSRLLGVPADPNGRLVIVTLPSTGEEIALAVDAVLALVAVQGSLDEIPDEIEQSLPPGWIKDVLAPSADRVITVLDLNEVLARKQAKETAS